MLSISSKVSVKSVVLFAFIHFHSGSYLLIFNAPVLKYFCNERTDKLCYHLLNLYIFIVHDPAFYGVVLGDLVHPFSELHRPLGIDLKADGDYHFQRIVVCIVGFSVIGSYPKFSDN